MAGQYTVVSTTTYTSNGTTVTRNVLQAEFTARGPYSFRRWYTCHVCAFDYPEDEVRLKSGVPFCIPRGHSKDMNDPLS
jgi:hypothetical protein